MRTIADIKRELVLAHRAEDWKLAARLSQEKETWKRNFGNRCVDCGAPLSRHGRNQRPERCGMHARAHIQGRRLPTHCGEVF
jgi:hypothetical protein